MGDGGAANDMMTLMEDLHVGTTFSTPDDVKTSQGLSNYLLNTKVMVSKFCDDEITLQAQN